MNNKNYGVCRFYLDGNMLPVTPGKIHYKNDNQNEAIDLMNGGKVSHLKLDGLGTFDFEFEVPVTKRPYAVDQTLKAASEYEGMLKALKSSRRPFQFIITRGNWDNENVKVSLEDYEKTQDAEDGNDFRFSVTLREYKEWHNMETDTNLNHHLILAKQRKGWK